MRSFSSRVIDFAFFHSHDAILLLCHSFSIPKLLLYILQTAPCFQSPHLQAYDELLRTILSDICNISLNHESTWLHASLPVRAGGIRIRRAAQLALSAFMASSAGSSDLVHQILPPHMVAPNPALQSALTAWHQGHAEPPPSIPTSHHQKVWDAPRIWATYDTLLDESSNARSGAD